MVRLDEIEHADLGDLLEGLALRGRGFLEIVAGLGVGRMQHDVAQGLPALQVMGSALRKSPVQMAWSRAVYGFKAASVPRGPQARAPDAGPRRGP